MTNCNDLLKAPHFGELLELKYLSSVNRAVSAISEHSYIMSSKRNEPNSRNQSLSSRILIEDSYDNVDETSLYDAVLKCLILEYRNEARFRTPQMPEAATSVSGQSKYSASNKIYRNSRADSNNDPKIPSYLLARLESHLNLIAMKKKGQDLDDMTRRSLLRLYSEILSPQFKEDVSRTNNPDYLVMRFISCANKEVVKLGNIPANQTSSDVVFKQADVFVQILISLIKKDKDSDVLIAKLKEHKASLRHKDKASDSLPSKESTSFNFLQPSFRITDMDTASVELISNLFAVDKVKMQQDIFSFKDIAQEKTLSKDIEQTLFYLGKNLGQLVPKSFSSSEAYESWKTREKNACNSLMIKYKVPAAQKLIQLPPLPSGDEFYVLPRSPRVRNFYLMLTKLCFDFKIKNFPKDNKDNSNISILPKECLSLLVLCARVWRVDLPTRAVSIFAAVHHSGFLKDSLTASKEPKELEQIDVNATNTVFSLFRKIFSDDENLWYNKYSWSLKDQELWSKCLSYSYQETLMAIKDLLHMTFNEQVKPRFSPFLQILGDYIESDPLFPNVMEFGVVKKWEKRLSKALLRVAENRYAESLTNLPRDDSLSVLHILDISDGIIKDIKMLRKRYKNPLLGFLDFPRTVGAVMCAMFGADAKNILKHIDLYARRRGEVIPYGDALEAYKSLNEIRFVYFQVANPGMEFKFDLERFFFPYVEAWVNESGQKIISIVQEAIKKDNYEAVDLEDNGKKFSSSILDIFSLVKEFLKILNNLNWPNEYQLAKLYTSLLKSISDGSLYYANVITHKIIQELDEEEQKKLLQQEERMSDNGKSGSWLDDFKNAVSNIQGSFKMDLEGPYNFKPETCVALNNLSAMMIQLDKLEELLDPESISSTVSSEESASSVKYTSHIFSIRLIKAENLQSGGTKVRPYVTLVDTRAKRTIGKTRASNSVSDPEWDEDFEITLPANTSLSISVTVWDEKLGVHSPCGRAILQLDPNNYRHDGIPSELYLDLDSQGRVLMEIATESERLDAIFVMGRAHRTLKRSLDRCIKLIVEKFSRFVHLCFSRNNLRSICGSNGMVRPTQDQMDSAMMPLYDYLNMNLQVLAEYLTTELLLKVMLASWSVVISSADELLLPKLSSAKTVHLLAGSSSSKGNGTWQSAVSSAVANVKNTRNVFGFGKQLTNIELETVFSWLNFLCFDFYHNDGNGPPVEDLKNEHYQALLLIPVYYDHDVDYLMQEVERLSPAFVKSLRDRNSIEDDTYRKSGSKSVKTASLIRNKTIMANATQKARADAARDAARARNDPSIAQVSTEDIILRLLLIKDERSFVMKRLEQREKLARSIATERLARAAIEGRFTGL